MDKLRTEFFTDPVICYFLDAFLVVYCLAATMLYFREKFSHVPPEVTEDNGVIYQELERPKDADPYQVLEPLKKKKKAGKKKKAQSSHPENKEKDLYESLNPSPASPPLSPE
ncbi:CD247 antigen like isoform X2 [Channa argus]|uniref:CD247 antigen like isoform X2 n=1 Tax=Channa argus TaxID=215402 RepID=UPI00351FF9E4